MIQLPELNNNTSVKEPQPLIAALYARVSTGRQEQEQTIEAQIDEIKARIVADDNVLPPENIFIDDGWTGEILQRPRLDAMRDAAVEGKFQALYVYDRGRLSRRFAHQEIIIEELTDKGTRFVTLHDVKAETPEEKVLQAMQGVFHEYERIKIVERMRRGKLFKAKQGILINGSSLYGYNYIKKTDTTPTHYEINKEEAEIIRKIFFWVGVERVSIYEVIKRLYDLGVPPRRGKTEFWTKGPIIRLLQCETYVNGTIYYGKTEAVVAQKPLKNDKYKKVKKSSRRWKPKDEWIAYSFKVPIIVKDRGLFERIQKILEFNQKYARKCRKYDYLLSGLVFCECGNRRAGDGYSKGNNHYYRCAERVYKFPAESKCKSQGVSAMVLDALFWKKLVRFLANPSLLREYAEKWLKSQANNSEAVEQGKKRLVGLLDKTREEELRYAKAYGTETLGFEEFKELMKEVKRKRLSYQEQLNKLSSEIAQDKANPIEVEELCQEAKRVIDYLDFSNKIQVIRDIIDKIILKGGREAEVLGHIPITTAKMAYEPIGRDSGVAKRWKVIPFQLTFKTPSRSSCRVSLHNNRTKRRGS